MLDPGLAIRKGKDHSFYAQYNHFNNIKNILLAYQNDELVGLRAIKEYEPGVMEIKKMFVPIHLLGKSITARVLAELE